MKSRTSCCNGAILKRTLFRGLPLWGSYLLCWLIALPVAILSNGETMHAAYIEEYVLESAAQISVVINFFYGLAAACMVSSYLYKSRSANFFGALPLRRETLFFTQYVSGLLYSLLPNLLIAVLSAAAGFCHDANLVTELLIWLAAQTLNFLFYYSFATLIAMIVGNLIALPLLYGVLSFTAVVIETMVRELLDLFVRGAWFDYEYLFDWASPFYYTLFSGDGPRAVYHWANELPTTPTFEGWQLLLTYAAVGLAFAAVAFWLHKKRRMEAAGDVIAVKKLKPVFLYCFTIGCSLVLGLALASIIMGGTYRDSFMTVLVCMLVGALIGYFVGQMLLHRSVRVFRSRYFANYGVVALVILAAMLCMRFDLFGYSSFVPKPQDVQAVALDYDGFAFSEDPALIEDAIKLHHAMIEEDNVDWAWYRTAYLTYKMKDGTYVRRSYDLPVSDESAQDPDCAIRMYEDIINDPDYIVLRELGGAYDAEDIEYCNIYNEHGGDLYLTPDETYEFLKTCVEPDLRETTLGWSSYSGRDVRQNYSGIHINVQFKDRGLKAVSNPGYTYVGQHVYITVTEDAARVLAFVKEQGMSVR